MRGGQIAGDALVVMLKNAGILKHGPRARAPDEVVGYLLAFFGLATQIKHGFSFRFPRISCSCRSPSFKEGLRVVRARKT